MGFSVRDYSLLSDQLNYMRSIQSVRQLCDRLTDSKNRLYLTGPRTAFESAAFRNDDAPAVCQINYN